MHESATHSHAFLYIGQLVTMFQSQRTYYARSTCEIIRDISCQLFDVNVLLHDMNFMVYVLRTKCLSFYGSIYCTPALYVYSGDRAAKRGACTYNECKIPDHTFGNGTETTSRSHDQSRFRINRESTTGSRSFYSSFLKRGESCAVNISVNSTTAESYYSERSILQVSRIRRVHSALPKLVTD